LMLTPFNAVICLSPHIRCVTWPSSCSMWVGLRRASASWRHTAPGWQRAGRRGKASDGRCCSREDQLAQGGALHTCHVNMMSCSIIIPCDHFPSVVGILAGLCPLAEQSLTVMCTLHPPTQQVPQLRLGPWPRRCC
jgi:hypothetical protein